VIVWDKGRYTLVELENIEESFKEGLKKRTFGFYSKMVKIER
jgi:hypothetical protein